MQHTNERSGDGVKTRSATGIAALFRGMMRVSARRGFIGNAATAGLFIGLPAIVGTTLLVSARASSRVLPPPVAPDENPVTETKRVLGKILFWDEQLSSDNVTSCGTCHISEFGGSDPRRARHPGKDGAFFTSDDAFGSPGVVNADADGDYLPSLLYELETQATPRNAGATIMAAYFPELFWDGRASNQFVDPQTGQVKIAVGGALESQAVAPPLSAVEMAHADRDWVAIASKLETARPLALATDIPPDMEAAVQTSPTYAALFASAFGDGAITSERIAFALATYQRTLIPDQSPWDQYDAGDSGALTPEQIDGMIRMDNATCTFCHSPPLFTDEQFTNIGLRPKFEDIGRQGVSGQTFDAARFKNPSLRNAGLRTSFMHNGQFTTLTEVVRFYGQLPGSAPRFNDNIHPLVAGMFIEEADVAPIVHFMETALTDPRVANRQFPFDRPTLFSERAGSHIASLSGTGVAGSGAILPRVIAVVPPMIGDATFKLGVRRGVAGGTAWLAISSTAPTGEVLTPEQAMGPFTLEGSGTGTGYATARLPLTPGAYYEGQIVYVQWQIEDANAPGGLAASDVVRLTMLCPTGGCAPACNADYNQDGGADTTDVIDLAQDIASGEMRFPPNTTDFNNDGGGDTTDVLDLANTVAGGGCP